MNRPWSTKKVLKLVMQAYFTAVVPCMKHEPKCSRNHNSTKCDCALGNLSRAVLTAEEHLRGL